MIETRYANNIFFCMPFLVFIGLRNVNTKNALEILNFCIIKNN